jgi:hypothetical protein
MHQVLVGLPQGVGGIAILFILLYFITVYVYNTHQLLTGLPQAKGLVALLLYFILYNMHQCA